MQYETFPQRLQAALDERAHVFYQDQANSLTPQLSPFWQSPRYVDIAALTARIARTKGPLAEAKGGYGAHVLFQLTPLGAATYELLPAIRAAFMKTASDLRWHPGIQLAIDAFGSSLQYLPDPANMIAAGHLQPIYATGLQLFADCIRPVAHRGDFQARVARHRNAVAEESNALSTYLKSARDLPSGSHLLRMELGGHYIQGLPYHDPAHEYLATRELGLQWLAKVATQWGPALVLDVLKVDRGTTTRYGLHVLLVLSGPSAAEVEVMKRTLADEWKALAGAQAFLFDCDSVQGLRFRGGGSGRFFNVPIEVQVANAVTYLAQTDDYCQVSLFGLPASLNLGRSEEINAAPRAKRRKNSQKSKVLKLDPPSGLAF